MNEKWIFLKKSLLVNNSPIKNNWKPFLIEEDVIVKYVC